VAPAGSVLSRRHCRRKRCRVSCRLTARLYREAEPAVNAFGPITRPAPHARAKEQDSATPNGKTRSMSRSWNVQSTTANGRMDLHRQHAYVACRSCGYMKLGRNRASEYRESFGGNTGALDSGGPHRSLHRPTTPDPGSQRSNLWAGGTTSCNLAEAAAALLPNRNILFAASAGLFTPPTHFF
jgi:hypothetical protein